tara:strand:+ start:2403 stop:2771 length:369 start_codon:yes stop_codon:yes gene_type:complete
MGYTNYWYQKRAFTDVEWKEVQDYFNYLPMLSSQIELDVLEFSDKVIQFNGHDPRSCENFTLYKNIREPQYEDENVIFNCCKTRQHPYDEVVWKVLKFIKFVVLDPKDKSFSISNDNGDSYE